MAVQTYKDLIVWQKSIDLVQLIYELTSLFPKQEQFGIISQLRRAAVSISSNIAEGFGRRSHKEYLQFYAVAYGSSLEIETQLIIAKKLRFVEEKKFEECEKVLNEVIRMLYVMVYGKKGVQANTKLIAIR